MKASRLLSIVLLLQSHGRLTGRELARRLEVSLRTLHRDMDALAAAGVPVFALRGARGGWQLDPDWRMRVPGLEDGELGALLLAQPRALGSGRLALAAERALEKLVAAMPAPLRERAASLRQRLHVDPVGWWGTAEDLSALPAVQEAVALDRRLELLYWKGNRERVERVVDPLGLVAKGGSWYLVARTAAGLRTFRISRIERATPRAEVFDRPADFDLAAAWRSSTEELARLRPRYAAVLRLEPGAARKLALWRPSEAVTPGAERAGSETRRVVFDDEEQALFVALGFGAAAEVVAPEALRRRHREEVARLAAATGARGGARKRSPR